MAVIADLLQGAALVAVRTLLYVIIVLSADGHKGRNLQCLL